MTELGEERGVREDQTRDRRNWWRHSLPGELAERCRTVMEKGEREPEISCVNYFHEREILL